MSASDKQIKAARKKLWLAGDLSWKLDPAQQKIHDFIKSDNQQDIVVINASRRLGKSFSLIALGIEMCIQKPKCIVKLIQPEQKMIEVNITPVIDKILEDCPEDLKPKYNKLKGAYVFPNGSQIQLAGTDNKNADKLRGGDADLCVVDEAGYCSDLNYLISSVLIPTTTITKGKIILSSTTPLDPEHEFIEHMKLAGSKEALLVMSYPEAIELCKDEEHSRTSQEALTRIINSIPGGEKSDAFQAEYLCKIVTKSNSTVIPEFDQEVEEDSVREWRRPDFCDKYVSMDIGFIDYTFVLFAFYDFQEGMVVIEDELMLNGPTMTTDALAEQIKEKERQLWYNKKTGFHEAPTLRVADNNLIVLNDLNRLHSLSFFPTQKDNRDMQINQLRMLIQSRQLVINPRCKNLVAHLKNATWDKTRKDFRRSEAYGHYDGVMALVYLLRNINMNRNPFPNGYKYYGISPDDLFVNNLDEDGKKSLETWGKTAFMPKKSKWRR
jgi:hypothetical protein